MMKEKYDVDYDTFLANLNGGDFTLDLEEYYKWNIILPPITERNLS